MLTAKEAVTTQMARRVSDLPDSVLAETFRSMLQAEAKLMTGSQPRAQTVGRRSTKFPERL